MCRCVACEPSAHIARTAAFAQEVESPVMKRMVLSAMMLSLWVAIGRAEEASPMDYRLVWSDEFEADGPPDPRKWTYEQGFVRNKELQWYQPDNAFCRDGKLIIEARRERKPNPNYEAGSRDWKRSREFIEYTSASVITRGLRTWTYGRFEIRAKIDISPGLWPAIWTLGSDRNHGRRWPECGEIDIMEYYQGEILANAFWAKQDGKLASDVSKTAIQKLTDQTPQAWAQQFHVWRMDWDEQAIRIYVDDRLLNTIELNKTINQTPEGGNPFHAPHYLLLNLALGGAGGDPSKTDFPRRYEIDYVRVYQKADPATPTP